MCFIFVYKVCLKHYSLQQIFGVFGSSWPEPEFTDNFQPETQRHELANTAYKPEIT